MEMTKKRPKEIDVVDGGADNFWRSGWVRHKTISTILKKEGSRM